MRFWNIDLDDWIRGHLDESVSTYTFRINSWYDNNNNSWYNEYSEFHDIIEWDKPYVLEKDLLDEEFQGISYNNEQEWPKELIIKEYQTMPDKQIHLEPFISYYYYTNTRPDASSRIRRRRRIMTKNLKDYQIIIAVLMLMITLEHLFILKHLFYTKKKKEEEKEISKTIIH